MTKKKIMLILLVIIIPTSYEAVMMKLPGVVIESSVDRAKLMRTYYRENKDSYHYSSDFYPSLSTVASYYNQNAFSDCGKLLDSNWFVRKFKEKTLQAPCMTISSTDSINIHLSNIDSRGRDFFYGCLIDGKSTEDCTNKYK